MQQYSIRLHNLGNWLIIAGSWMSHIKHKNTGRAHTSANANPGDYSLTNVCRVRTPRLMSYDMTYRVAQNKREHGHLRLRDCRFNAFKLH